MKIISSIFLLSIASPSVVLGRIGEEASSLDASSDLVVNNNSRELALGQCTERSNSKTQTKCRWSYIYSGTVECQEGEVLLSANCAKSSTKFRWNYPWNTADLKLEHVDQDANNYIYQVRRTAECRAYQQKWTACITTEVKAKVKCLKIADSCLNNSAHPCIPVSNSKDLYDFGGRTDKHASYTISATCPSDTRLVR